MLLWLVVFFAVPLFAQPFIDPEGRTVESRFIPPPGYARMPADEISYDAYLRNLPLLPHGSPVKYYDGTEKPNDDIYVAVVAIDIGLEDLQQAPEICIRLRGEYLFKQEQYNKISFTISNHKNIPYVDWVEGLKMIIDGKTYWTKSPTEADRYATFKRYLDFIFTHADIETLLDDVQRSSLDRVMPGDMLIQITRPGHVVVVLDVAENAGTGDRVFLLAQSYKPAQSLHVLVNPGNEALSPWHSVSDIDDKILTPEFIFYKRDLRRFREMTETPPKKKTTTFYF
ncbi:MAG: DUF4846 domain-containing protein [Prevotellaceae bacterium]|nr:DUF4846 domain-containing protein [Prevotellaceae bacterium]